MQCHAFAFKTVPTLPYNFTNTTIEWISKGDMAHKATLEEGERPDAFRPINDLIWHYEISWLDLFLQTTSCGKCNNAPHADLAQCGDIRPSRHLVWRKLVVHTMTS